MTMPRRRRAAATDAHLDDLLRFEDAAPGPPRPRPPADGWLARAAVAAFVLSAVAYTAFRVFSVAAPYPMILAVCLGAALIRRAVALSREQPWLRTGDEVRAPAPPRAITPGGWYADPDGLHDAIRRWVRRLDWGATAPQRFASTVTERLGQLADEVLRQRHGLTRAADPDRARHLLGPDLWDLLHAPAGQVPPPARIAAAVQRLESL